MPKLLFLVHVEECFRNYFPLDYDEMIESAWEDFDHIVVLDSGINNDVLDAAKSVATEVWEWSYGYEPEQFYDPGDKCWVIESYGHTHTWVPYELRQNLDWVKSHEVYIAGGSNYECLEDWRAVLRHMDIEFGEVPYLIY